MYGNKKLFFYLTLDSVTLKILKAAFSICDICQKQVHFSSLSKRMREICTRAEKHPEIYENILGYFGD